MNNLKIVGYLCIVALSCILFTTHEHIVSFWSIYFKIVKPLCFSLWYVYFYPIDSQHQHRSEANMKVISGCNIFLSFATDSEVSE